MGKNKRKRKLKEQDFKKIKLKVGKKLLPAQNATDTSFKSRAIFIPSQLNEDSEPTNQRHQNLKDLLAQVGHYSATTRQEAFVGLRDLFQLHGNVLHENLGLIIKRVAEKITDSDASVRQSLLLLLRSIFPSILQEKMAPFCPLIMAHLSCAMTHIYDEIQHDSLNFLELCLQCFPECMVTSSSQLIQNFIGMISHRSSASISKQGHGGKGLSVNPKGKLSSPKSRLKILQHLLAFLKALESSCSSNNGMSNCFLSSVGNDPGKKPAFQFQKHGPTQVQILQHSVEVPTVAPFIIDGGVSLGLSPGNSEGKSNILSDAQQVRDLMETIVPLLLECWIECNPAQMTTGLPDSVMSSCTIHLMLAITDVLKVLFKAAQRTWIEPGFEQSSGVKWSAALYFKDFNQQFMVYFPFVASSSMSLKRDKRKLGKISQRSVEGKDAASVLALNFAVCEIMLQFLDMGNIKSKDFGSSVQKLEEFVIESLELKADGGAKSRLLQTEHVESLVVFANQLVLFYCNIEQDSGVVKELLDAAYKLYQSSHVMSGSKNALLQFFASLVFSEDHVVSRHAEVRGLVEKWLQVLPSLLMKLKDTSPDMTEVVLKVLTKAVMQGVVKPDVDFLSQLAMFFSKSSGPFVRLSEAMQRSAVELLFHLPSLDDQFLHVLVEVCQAGKLRASMIQYLLQILHYRSPCYQGSLSRPAAFFLATYLSVLFSVAIGYSKTQLSEYQVEGKLEQSQKHAKLNFVILEENWQDERLGITEDVQFNSWKDHKTTLKAVCQNYRQCSRSQVLLQYMDVALRSFLVDFKVLPVRAVHSLLCVVTCLVELSSECGGAKDDSTSSKPGLGTEVSSSLAELSLVCLISCTNTNSSNVTTETHSEDLTAATVALKQDLFEAVAELLCSVPLTTAEMLVLFLKVVSVAADNCETIKQTFAEMLTKLLDSGVKKILLQSADIVQRIVSRILNPEGPGCSQSQSFADLQYQYSVFKVEASQA